MFLAEKASKDTEKQIAVLKENAKNAAYVGEIVGYVSDIDTSKLDEDFPKDSPDFPATKK